MAQKLTRLKVICPQEYDGVTMQITACVRCTNWQGDACNVYMGVEHLPPVVAADVPGCPESARCQHQIQRPAEPCPPRARGLLCESVVGPGHPLAFSAYDF